MRCRHCLVSVPKRHSPCSRCCRLLLICQPEVAGEELGLYPVSYRRCPRFEEQIEPVAVEPDDDEPTSELETMEGGWQAANADPCLEQYKRRQVIRVKRVRWRSDSMVCRQEVAA